MESKLKNKLEKVETKLFGHPLEGFFERLFVLGPLVFFAASVVGGLSELTAQYCAGAVRSKEAERIAMEYDGNPADFSGVDEDKLEHMRCEYYCSDISGLLDKINSGEEIIGMNQKELNYIGRNIGTYEEDHGYEYQKGS